MAVTGVDGLGAAVWGDVRPLVGIRSGAAAVAPNHLVVIGRLSGNHDIAAARAVRLNFQKGCLETSWEGKLPVGPMPTYQGNPFLPHTSAVIKDEDCLYLLSGSKRLLVRIASGAMVAETTCPASPSAPATFTGQELLVPEGRELAAYSPDTLVPLWKKATPDRLWGAAPVLDQVCPLEVLNDRSEVNEVPRAGLWFFRRGDFVPVEGARAVRSAPVVIGSTMLLASGAAAASRVDALDVATGASVWSADSPAQGSFVNGVASTNEALAGAGDRVVAITDTPAVEARSAGGSGDLAWRVPLPASPTALAVYDGVVWAGTDEGDVLAIDAASGASRGRQRLYGTHELGELLRINGVGEGVAAILRAPGSSVVLIVGVFGTVFGVAV